ncbi:RecT family recombinase [Wenyingzhuangia sp. 2_MG-2023]|uniref:RecT family recombinase n=1 Tax=Wenyingzhuangia sp. 2_MG-2023 TaxID=3062639 RepID=UPI0026E3A15F|nr:RecT family recombinase [Wenyingzhuangia sp. 2_MG-2023]MDO6737135.1 RecT family recombinase [Wenyingzhuangia sp. 2_MG-2023]
MSNNKNMIIATERQVDIAKAFKYSIEEVAVIQNTVAKGTNGVELGYFLSVCKSVDLNPFNKEIWCYKDNKNNIIIITGRDGFLTKAQRSPQYNGIRSSEVCEKDVFNLDVANNKITHNITESRSKRGAIIGAYAIAFRKDGEPTIEWADFATYNKGSFVWKSHDADMIKKVAESHALKKAFGMSNLHSEYDFNTSSGIAVPVNQESTSNVDTGQQKKDDLRDKKTIEVTEMP